MSDKEMDWKEGCAQSGMKCPQCGKEMLVGEVITLGQCIECENADWRKIIEEMK